MQEEQLVEKHDNYSSAYEEVVNILTKILEQGEITQQDKDELDYCASKYTNTLTETKTSFQNTQIDGIFNRLDALEHKRPISKDEVMDILTDGGRKTFIYYDDDGNILFDGNNIPELNVTKLTIDEQNKVIESIVSESYVENEQGEKVKLKVAYTDIKQTVDTISTRVDQIKKDGESLEIKFNDMTDTIDGHTRVVGKIEEGVIREIKYQYYLSLSKTELTGGKWQDTMPTVTPKTFLWYKTTSYYTNDAIAPKTTKAVCVTAKDGNNVEKIQQEYAISTSSTYEPTSGWTTTMPEYEEGYYLWLRTAIKYSNKSAYEYSQATCDQTWKEVKKIYTKYEELADRFRWIVDSGDSASSMQLTDRMFELISKKIELKGSININNGTFKVATNGNTKIGGPSNCYIEGYYRAKLEITSEGSLYSTGTGGIYTKIEDGTINVHDAAGRLQLDADSIWGTNDLWIFGGGGAGVKVSGLDGKDFFRPHRKGMRLGSSGYPWDSLWLDSKDNINTNSDIRLKENIADVDERFEKMMLEIKPIRYTFKNKDHRKETGFSAQQVQELMDKYNISYEEFNGLNVGMPESGCARIFDDEGNVLPEYSLSYLEFIPLNTHMIQKLYQKLEDKNNEINLLDKRIKKLEGKLSAIKC